MVFHAQGQGSSERITALEAQIDTYKVSCPPVAERKGTTQLVKARFGEQETLVQNDTLVPALSPH